VIGAPVDLAILASQARESGEAYLAIMVTESCRLGIEARWDGRLSLELEGEVRLLPPGEVDPASLGPVLHRLSGLAALGFRLRHFGDGWVLATRPMEAEETAEAVEACVRLLEPEYINHRPA